MGKINSVIGNLFGTNASVAAFDVKETTDIEDENYNVRNVLSSNTKDSNGNEVEDMNVSIYTTNASNDELLEHSFNSTLKNSGLYDIINGTNNNMETTTVDTSAFNNITGEDIQNLVGTMSQEEYDQYVKGVQDYYTEQEGIIDETVFGEGGFNDILTDITTIYSKYDIDYSELKQYYTDELTNLWYSDPNLYESEKTYDEFINMSYGEKITFLDGKSSNAIDILTKEKDALSTYDSKVAAECSDYGITTMEELVDTKNQLTETVATAKESLEQLEKCKNSAEYDYLYFLEDFNNYEMKTDFTESELKELDNCFKVVGENGLEAYQYSEYVKDHPEVTLTEFALMVYQYDTNAVCCDENGNSIMSNDVYDVTKISSVNADYAKVYQYLLETNPEKASKFVDACEYEINQYQGQIEANEFLEEYMKEADGDPIEALSNELHVSTEGFVSGVGSFGEGLYYSGEAITTALGITEENRTQSVQSYKDMYIIQSLMSTDDKLKYGLVYYDENGNLQNTDSNSAIDYTVDYSGIFLNNNYEISKGIGNMAPSIVMNTVTPGLGITTLGVSAGGNAYHGSMVEGNDYAASVFYGVCTGLSESVTEKMLGGIPGLSDTQVNSLSSYVKAVGKEGMQESFQECLDITTRCLVLDEELPTTVDGWKSLGGQIVKAGAYGAITAGILNSPSLLSKVEISTQNKVESTAGQSSNTDTDSVDVSDPAAVAVAETVVAEATDTEVEVENTTDINETTTNEVEELDLSEEVTNESTEDIEETTTEDVSANNENTSVDYETITQQISEEGVTILNGKSGTEVIDIIKYCQETGQIDLINEIMSYDNVNEQYFIDMTSTILESSLNYYENAAEYANTASEFKTYRDHCEKHVQEVAIKALQACENIKTSLETNPVEGFSSDIDPYECFVAGIWHDTGMAAGSDNVFGLNSYVDADNNIKAEVLHDNNNGALTRSNHSFNSAMYVLENSSEISAYGVDTNLVALLCFAHSKSNSGVSTLNSASDWSVCINKINEGVIEYNKQNPNSPITFSNTGGTDFIESLVASGVLDNTDYIEKVYTYTKKGVTYTFNYKEYNINSDTLGKLASEAYALRLGDANTNNSNIGTNQAGQKIDFSSVSGDKNISFETTTVDKDGNTVSVFKNMGSAISNEVPNLSINIGDETVNLESIGAAFVLGEENIDFSSDTKNGILVEKFSIKDPTDIPACTVFNIGERLGETDTAQKGNFQTYIEIELDSTNVPESQKASIENYYRAYMETHDSYEFDIVWK